MDDQLKMLFDYTKFHIGVYISIGTGIVGALAFDQANDIGFALGCARTGFQFALFFQVLAGLGGGIICTCLMDYTSYATFNKSNIFLGFSAKSWERFEHGMFWVSILVGAMSGAYLIPRHM